MSNKNDKQKIIKKTLEDSIDDVFIRIKQIIPFMAWIEKYGKNHLKYKKDILYIEDITKKLRILKIDIQKLNSYTKNAPLKIFK